MSHGHADRIWRGPVGHVTGHSIEFQGTWLVTAEGGEPLARLPMRVFDGSERQ